MLNYVKPCIQGKAGILCYHRRHAGYGPTAALFGVDPLEIWTIGV